MAVLGNGITHFLGEAVQIGSKRHYDIQDDNLKVVNSFVM